MKLELMAVFMSFLLTATLYSAKDLKVFEAEMSVPFGVAEGKLLLVDDLLIFIDEDEPESSFAVERASLNQLSVNDQNLTIRLAQEVNTRGGARGELTFRLSQDAGLAAMEEWGNTAVAPRRTTTQHSGDEENILGTYDVEHNHLIGSCQGQLVITTQGISYESRTKLSDSRDWSYSDIENFKSESPHEIEIESFRGNDYDFNLAGDSISSSQLTQVQERIAAARVRDRR